MSERGKKDKLNIIQTDIGVYLSDMFLRPTIHRQMDVTI